MLGSAQARLAIDGELAKDLGIDVVRRRSGGGAVLLEPGGAVWVDVVIPRGDPLWSDDVVAAFGWLGRAWRDALDLVGVATTLHERPSPATDLGRLACFAGVGAGELTLDGRKVLGVSQRRTATGARFQCLLLRRWEPALLARLLGIEDAVDELTAAAVGLDVDPDRVIDALHSTLPTG